MRHACQAVAHCPKAWRALRAVSGRSSGHSEVQVSGGAAGVGAWIIVGSLSATADDYEDQGKGASISHIPTLSSLGTTDMVSIKSFRLSTACCSSSKSLLTFS